MANRKAHTTKESTATIGFESKLWLAADTLRNIQHPDLRADWRIPNTGVELIYGDRSLEAGKQRSAPLVCTRTETPF